MGVREALRSYVRKNGITNAEAIRILGVSDPWFYKTLSGRGRLTLYMAKRLASRTPYSIKYWLDAQLVDDLRSCEE